MQGQQLVRRGAGQQAAGSGSGGGVAGHHGRPHACARTQTLITVNSLALMAQAERAIESGGGWATSWWLVSCTLASGAAAMTYQWFCRLQGAKGSSPLMQLPAHQHLQLAIWQGLGGVLRHHLIIQLCLAATGPPT